MRSVASRLGVLAPLAIVAASAFFAACSVETDAESASADITQSVSFFGDDRVGAVLRTKPMSIPPGYPEYEKLFKVGRECGRTNSKEIFIIEERVSRAADGSGYRRDDTAVLPRAVITGCNTTGDIKDSYSLTASLESDPAVPAKERRDNKNDVMSFTPLEVQALDNATGLMNYYLFERTTEGKPGQVTRFFLDAKGRVVQRTLQPNGKVSPIVPGTLDGKPSQRCFGCHVNGAPLMNELHEPWSNWISSRSQAARGAEGGATQNIVDEAIPNAAAPGRSSLANELEQIMSQGIQNYVSGNGTPGHGWGPALLAGKLPGGVTQLLKSSFCETELNYESSREVIPLELFFDPDATAAAGLVEPDAVAGQTFPFLMPTRSQFDKSVENFLGSARILRNATLQALRLIDDENEIFSSLRCDLMTDFAAQISATEKLKTAEDFAKLDRTLADYLSMRLSSGRFPWASSPDLLPKGACDLTKGPGMIQPETCPLTSTRQYARAHLVNELLVDDSTEESIDAYGTELNTRYAAKKALYAADRTSFVALDAFRKAEASKLFGCSAGTVCGPMPDLLTR